MIDVLQSDSVPGPRRHTSAPHRPSRRAIALLALLPLACSRDEPSDPEPSSPGRVLGEQVLVAPPGDRPDGRLKGSFEVELQTEVGPRSWLRVDQGYVEDGHEIFGPTVRYRLPPLAADLLGRAYGAAVQLHRPEGRPRECPVKPLDPRQGWFAAYLEDGAPAGSRLVVEFGAAGIPGPITPTVPLEVELHAFVDDRSGSQRLPGAVPLRVVDPRIDWLRVLGPATAAPGEPLRFGLCFMNGLSGPRASSMVAPRPEALELEGRRGGADWRALAFEAPEPDLSFPAAIEVEVEGLPAGLHRLEFRARTPDGTWTGVSAPLRVGGASRLLFGSLHNHSALGGHAASTPRRTFRYAREVARLDFCGLSEHAESPLLDWPWLQELEAEESREGRFVAFLGFEWTHPLDGHRHVIYRRAAGKPVLAATPAPDLAPEVRLADSLEALAEIVGDDPDALIAVHHPLWFAGVAQRSYRYGDPALMPRQRLGEVYSWHGSSFGGPEAFPIHDSAAHRAGSDENGLRRALDRGHDLRLVADADNHLGRPGSLVGVEWEKALRYAYQGLTAVRVPAVDRNAIFDALDALGSYGTTGARLHLDARRNEDGSVVLEVHATAPLASILLHTPQGPLGELSFDPIEPDRASEGAALYLDPARGVWDHRCRFDSSRGIEAPLWLEVVQQDQHRAWIRVDA